MRRLFGYLLVIGLPVHGAAYMTETCGISVPNR